MRRRIKSAGAQIIETTLVAPPLIGEEPTVTIRGRKVPFHTAAARNISPGSTAGIAGLVLPAGMTSGGLPVGIEFDAPAASNRHAFAQALATSQVSVPRPDAYP